MSSDEDAAYESADEGGSPVAMETKMEINEELTTTGTESDNNTNQVSKGVERCTDVDVKHEVENAGSDSVSEEPKNMVGVENVNKPSDDADETVKTKVDETEGTSDIAKELSESASDIVNKPSESTSDIVKDSSESTSDIVKEPSENVITSEERAPKKGPMSEEEKIHSALDKLAGNEGENDTSTTAGSSSWGGWGSSWLSSATSSVSSFTQIAGQGLTTMIENVEATLGIPNPEDVTEEDVNNSPEDKKIKDSKDEEKEESGEGGSGEGGSGDAASGQSASGEGASSGGFLSAIGVTALVSGGLEALEILGKKTMDVLQEGDPGLRIKRKYFKEVTTGNKPNLSLLLREAKEEAERYSKQEQDDEEQKKAHFGLLFDEYQGLAHLEALEILSNQSENKVQTVLGSLSGDDLEILKTELIEIKDAFYLDDIDENQEKFSDEEFVNAITEHLFGLSIGATPDKLKQIQIKAHDWLTLCKKEQAEKQKREPKDIHMVAIQTLAELTAKSIEQFHKASELMLLQQLKDKERKPIERATSLSKLTSSLCSEVAVLSTKFGECLNTSSEWCDNPSSVNPYITNVYLEASNSASYIQDAFQLVLPILQIVAIEMSNAKDQL